MEAHDIFGGAASEAGDSIEIRTVFFPVADWNLVQGSDWWLDPLAWCRRQAEHVDDLVMIGQERIDVHRHGVIRGDDVAHATEPSSRHTVGDRQTRVVQLRIDARCQLESDAGIADIDDSNGHD
jgi:hypothetical protein